MAEAKLGSRVFAQVLSSSAGEENLTLMDTCFSLAEPPQTED